MKHIVFTGGPGAGKTVIARRIAEAQPQTYVLVPEAATQVYDALQTRWDRLDLQGRRDVQRQIYRLQIEQEQRLAERYPQRILLLDRGTVDGAAYWPDGPHQYWRELGTSLGAQLQRYDAVIWMESCAALGLYDGDHSNACRFEDAAAAVESGKLLLHLWQDHPNLLRVGAFADLDDKLQAVMQMLATLIGLQ